MVQPKWRRSGRARSRQLSVTWREGGLFCPCAQAISGRSFAGSTCSISGHPKRTSPKALSEQIGLSRAGDISSLRRCVIPSVALSEQNSKYLERPLNRSDRPGKMQENQWPRNPVLTFWQSKRICSDNAARRVHHYTAANTSGVRRGPQLSGSGSNAPGQIAPQEVQ